MDMRVGRAKGETHRRLPKEQRRRQLLDTALKIVRAEGADRLTLGHLAASAGVSKPIAYEHFGTRSGLMIALYRSIDEKQLSTLRESVAESTDPHESITLLAQTYVHCSADTEGVWLAVGDALSGSREMDAVSQELTDEHVRLFASVLAEHTSLSGIELDLYCIGLIGAGDALSDAMVRGRCTESQAIDAFSSLISSTLPAAK